MPLKDLVNRLSHYLLDHVVTAILILIFSSIAGGAGYLARAYFSRDCQQQLHESQVKLETIQTKLRDSEADLEKANKRIAELRLKQAPPDLKKLNDLTGTYIWQVIDDKNDWKGDIDVSSRGVVKDMQMVQFLNCGGERRNSRLLNLLPNASLKYDDKSANLHVEIPAQFFTYKPGSCDNFQVEEKTLDGDLTPTIAYVGSVKYKTASGGTAGGMMIVRKLPGMFP